MAEPEHVQRHTLAGLHRLISDATDDAEAAHTRLRNDLKSVQERLMALESQHTAMVIRIQRLEDYKELPIEVSTLRFSPQIVFAICAAVVSIIGGSYAVNTGQRQATDSLHADIREVVAKFENQNKINDERQSAFKAAIDAIDKRQQLQQYDLQAVKEALMRKGIGTR